MRLATASTLFALAACATSAPIGGVLTVDEVLARHVELDGQRIRVSGWIPARCYGHLGRCELSSSLEVEATFLAIGDSARINTVSKGLVGKSVVIEAMLDAKCLHAFADRNYPHGLEPPFVICSDRASMLIDPIILKN